MSFLERQFLNERFGMLTIIEELRPNVFKCRCKCGGEIEAVRSQLANRVFRHCGCRDKRKPALIRKKPFHTLHYRSIARKNGGWRKKFITGELYSYMEMKRRCYGKIKNSSEYSCERHGGRGIRVCDRWLEPNGKGFQNFLDDLGPRPSHTTLDRVNPQDHYTPLNCKWGTPEEQAWHQTRIMWKDETPPPVPLVGVMNEMVNDWSFANESEAIY
jgi:hypothetical protein